MYEGREGGREGEGGGWEERGGSIGELSLIDL